MNKLERVEGFTKKKSGEKELSSEEDKNRKASVSVENTGTKETQHEPEFSTDEI